MTDGGREALSRNPYRNPELFRFVGSMEGVPDWLDHAERSEERAGRSGWRRTGHRLLEMTGALAPGVALALALAFLGAQGARAAGEAMGLERSPISPILLAILLGLAIRNTVGLPAVYEAGLQLCLKRVLRIGVALLGLRLSLAAAGAIGLVALPVVAACILSAIFFVTVINRAVGLPARLGTLIAVGTAICGNTAIVATGPVIRANEDEVSYAVGTITVFGLVALVAYPFLAHGAFGGDATLAGFFLGTAIHDTAQVAGAGLLYGQQYGGTVALETATVTKLVRNLSMVVVIPGLALAHHRSSGEKSGAQRPALAQALPLFVFGFVGLALLRTLGDWTETPFGGALSESTWASILDGAGTLSTWCLAVAMASVGLGTNFRRLSRLGLRPLFVGLAAATAVGVVSAALVALAIPRLQAMLG